MSRYPSIVLIHAAQRINSQVKANMNASGEDKLPDEELLGQVSCVLFHMEICARIEGTHMI